MRNRFFFSRFSRLSFLLFFLFCLSIHSGCAAFRPEEPPKSPIHPPKSTGLPESAPASSLPEPPLNTIIIPDTSTPDDDNTEIQSIKPESPLSGHIICLDPGHCVTPDAEKGYQEPVSPLSDETKPRYLSGTEGAVYTEEQLNLIVGLKLRDRLSALGAEVVMTREVSEISLPNTERCRIANESGADVFIHIHADGADSPSPHGVSVLIPSGEFLGTPSIQDESARLGHLMVDAVAQETGAKNLGTIPRSDLTGLNFSEIPSVFIEMGFMSNPEEDALLSSEDYQDKIVTGMANSLISWYHVLE